jgi:hypothetical protein
LFWFDLIWFDPAEAKRSLEIEDDDEDEESVAFMADEADEALDEDAEHEDEQ